MTARDGFDRLLADWFQDEPVVREPEHLLGTVLARTARTRRRPAWLIPERWIPMTAISGAAAATPTSWKVLGALALLIVALVAGALLISGSRPPRELPAPFGPAANGLVAYAANGDIHTADPATSRTRAVITGAAQDRDPVWSLDGARLAFVRAEEGGERLYVARDDGSDLTPVTPEPLVAIAGYSFSPDGLSVVFTYSDGPQSRLAIGRTDGSGYRPLDVGMDASRPAFRPPSGDEILFVGSGDAGDGLYVVAAAGTGLRALLEPTTGLRIGVVSYSPDGTRIAYDIADTRVRAYTARTHVMAADGTGERLLDPGSPAVWDGGAKWSNDGTRLAVIRGYSSDGYDGARVAVVPVNDSGSAVESDPSVVLDDTRGIWAWAPDDATILWTVTDEADAPVGQLLIDTATVEIRPAPWDAASPPAWQRVVP